MIGTNKVQLDIMVPVPRGALSVCEQYHSHPALGLRPHSQTPSASAAGGREGNEDPNGASCYMLTKKSRRSSFT